jgi:hypothetical protein
VYLPGVDPHLPLSSSSYHRGNAVFHNTAIHIMSYDTFCSLASRILWESSAPKKYAVSSSETVVTTFPDYAHNDNHVRSMSTKSYTRNVSAAR